MEQEPQEMSNDQVKFTIHRKPACRVELHVHVFPPLVKSAHGEAVKAISKEVSLPGFRKGRAPEQLIEKNFPNDVNKKWQEKIAGMAFGACEKLARVPILHRDSKISFDMKSHSLDKGADLILSFETEPTIPTVDPKQIHLKSVKRPDVNEEKIQETIRQIQLFFAEWKKVEGRGVQDGDFVLVDVDVIEETPPTSLFSNTRFEVTKKSMAEWMYPLVIGKTVGATAEGTSVPDDSLPADEKEAFKPKKVKVTIKAIEQATTPPVDHHFANKLGVASLEDMHESLKRLLNAQADAHVRTELREQINNYLLEHYSFELPVSLIEKETHFRLRQLMQDSQFLDYWNRLGTEEKKKIIDSIYEQSGKAVRMFYLCRKIIADAKITVSPNDVPPAAATPLEALVNPQAGFHAQHDPELHQAEVFSRLLLEKAEDYLIEHAAKG